MVPPKSCLPRGNPQVCVLNSEMSPVALLQVRGLISQEEFQFPGPSEVLTCPPGMNAHRRVRKGPLTRQGPSVTQQPLVKPSGQSQVPSCHYPELQNLNSCMWLWPRTPVSRPRAPTASIVGSQAGKDLCGLVPTLGDLQNKELSAPQLLLRNEDRPGKPGARFSSDLEAEGRGHLLAGQLLPGPLSLAPACCVLTRSWPHLWPPDSCLEGRWWN